MAFKYIYLFGDTSIPGFAPLYIFAHIPLDNIILERLVKDYGATPIKTLWSKLDDYAEYLKFQRWVRCRFSSYAPLAVEFRLWQQPYR